MLKTDNASLKKLFVNKKLPYYKELIMSEDGLLF